MTLSPGDVCTIDVNFGPTTSGVFTSSFAVASNALDDPTVTVNLQGGSGADLTGEWSVPVTQVCTSKCKLTGSLRVKNIGNLSAVSSAVRFYLSDDGVHYTEGGFLKQVSTGAIKAGLSKVKKLSVTLPTGSSATGKYVLSVIDSSNIVTEANEGNNNVASGPIP
jgi:subtilase family serine protease